MRTLPVDAISEWFVKKREGTSELEVQLAKAIHPNQDVTVIVDGRLESTSIAAPLPSATLQMVQWHGVRVDEHLLAFQSVEPYSVETTGGLPVATAEQLAARDVDLIDAETSDNAVYDLWHAPPSAGASRYARAKWI